MTAPLSPPLYNNWIHRESNRADFWHWKDYKISQNKGAPVLSITSAVDRKFTAFCGDLVQAKAICQAHDMTKGETGQ